MTTARRALVPAIGGFRASPQSYYGTGAVGAVASGPAGSASMTFFCVCVPQRGNTTRVLFARTNPAATGGWGFLRSGTPGTLLATSTNSTPSSVQVNSGDLSTTLEGFGGPYLLLASYQNGTLTFWANGILVGTNPSGVGGYTARSAPTAVGVASTSAVNFAAGESIADCGMLDTYDAASYVDPIFGNGGVGLSMRWLADLREGRYLTWPRAGTANADWYWAARDCVEGPGSLATTWVDRYSGIAMLKFGQPQGASFPARF